MPEHGTVNMYSNHGCRCGACRYANTLYERERREQRKENTQCPNCGGPGDVYKNNVCSACYDYERRYGVPRPPEVYDPPPRFCDNCDREMSKGESLRKGRCEACARYLDRNGRERPERLFA